MKKANIDPLNVRPVENISKAIDKSFGMHKENTSIVNALLNKSGIPQGEAKKKG
jgi:hypothetical protein